ncbi:hypothetical protein OsJ_06983 [Oryza sativa Japonica Group]|uniref:Uncharacterized protein n=1 Tax=Oryza sativa subsp. japonica TaxID=39947 RepID=A3A7J7_ORYSJ|nr:hypothetical protein OsJ_06983 [Oryza sativa Japonica Group]
MHRDHASGSCIETWVLDRVKREIVHTANHETTHWYPWLFVLWKACGALGVGFSVLLCWCGSCCLICPPELADRILHALDQIFSIGSTSRNLFFAPCCAASVFEGELTFLRRDFTLSARLRYKPINWIEAPARAAVEEVAENKTVRELLEINPHKCKKVQAPAIPDDDTLLAHASGSKSKSRKRGPPSQAPPAVKKLFKEGDSDEKETTVSYYFLVTFEIIVPISFGTIFSNVCKLIMVTLAIVQPRAQSPLQLPICQYGNGL